MKTSFRGKPNSPTFASPRRARSVYSSCKLKTWQDERQGTRLRLETVVFYYPTTLRRVQITPKTGKNITRYLYSSGPVRQVSCF